MNDMSETPRELLEAYEKALRDYSQASTPEEGSDAIVDLREVTCEMETRSAEMAQALRELLEQRTQCCNPKEM